MLELVRRRHVAEREHTARGGLAGTRRPPPGRQRRPRRPRVGVQQVAVGSPAGRDQQHVAAHAGRRRGSSTSTPVADAAHCGRRMMAQHSHFLAAMSVNRSQMSSSCARSSVEPRIMNVTRLPSAENTCANSAATKPPPTITRCSGSVGDPHDRVTGVVRNRRTSRLVGDDRARTRRDHHLIGGELVTVVGAQRVAAVRQRRGETGVRTEHRDVRRRTPVVLATHRDRVDAAEDTRDDVGPAHPVDVGVDAVSALSPRHSGRRRRRRRTSWSGCSRRSDRFRRRRPVRRSPPACRHSVRRGSCCPIRCR